MTPSEYAQRIAAKERELGLPEGELRAIWQQESSGSVDPTLKGPSLSRGRGNAVGPFQVVPYYHPQFPAGGDPLQQLDFAANLYASLGSTPDQRAARYYGTGQAPAGHPTTGQYVSQVKARMGGQPAAVQQSQQQPQMPEQTMPNANTYQPQYMQVPEPINYDDLPAVPMPREPTGVEKWLSNPLVHMGAAIMAASGSPLGAPIGYGVTSAASGLGDAQKAENDLYELQLKREQAKRQLMSESRKAQTEALDWNQKQSAIADLWKLADEYDKAGKPMEAAKVRAGIKSGLDPAHAGLTPQFLVSDDGKTAVQRIYKSDGTFVDTPLGNMRPASISPETQGRIAEAKGGGKVIGESNATTMIDAPKVIAAADQAINLLEQERSHPGKAMATGFIGSKIPESWLSGTTAGDYVGLVNQIRSGAFMSVFPTLKGGGAITETEGEKATQAYTRFSRANTEEERRKAVDEILEIARKGKARAEAGVMVSNPYAGKTQAPQAAPQGAGILKFNPATRRVE